MLQESLHNKISTGNIRVTQKSSGAFA